MSGWLLVLEYGVAAATVEPAGRQCGQRWPISGADTPEMTTSFIQAWQGPTGLTFPIARVQPAGRARHPGGDRAAGVGVSESANVNNVIVMSQGRRAAAFHRHGHLLRDTPDNWQPFIPANEGEFKYGLPASSARRR